jgi:crotonobetaine/carnitine-CoA ligase
MRLLSEELDALTVGDLVKKRASNGDKPLAIIRGQTLSYREAHERSTRIASSLLEAGVRKGDVVATYLYNSIDHVCIWFACAKLGAIWTPLNVSLVNNDLSYSLNDCTAKVVIVDEDLLDNYQKVRADLTQVRFEVVAGHGEAAQNSRLVNLDRLEDGNHELPEIDVSPSDPMAITYTGGSTGMPKGVLLPHLYFFANALRYRDSASATSTDVHFTVHHLFHAGGQLLGIMGPMYSSMTTVMTKWFSASRYWESVRACNATVIDPIGPIIAAIMRQPESPLDQSHKVRVGVGVATGQIRREIRSEFERRFNVPLLEVYAQTEDGIALTYETLEDRAEGRGSCGKPKGWVEISILGDHDVPLAPREVGEIALRMTPPYCFMLEYWRKYEETVKSWRNLWFHTGDQGYLDEDGYLYFTGRLAHWMRRKGENVSAFEVEKALASHPRIVDCAVVGVPAEMGDEDIKAYVQLGEGSGELDPAELVAWCQERIAYFKVPRYIEYISEFPRSTAKREIERHKLRERGVGEAWDREAHGAVRAPVRADS